MDQAQDVEHLFSWLKAPMVHYREFAPRLEVAEAVATWPIVHRTAVETGVAPADAEGPHGDAAAHERAVRDRRGLPAATAEAVRESPLSAAAAPNPAAAGDIAAAGEGTPAARPRRGEPARAQPTREPSEATRETAAMPSSPAAARQTPKPNPAARSETTTAHPPRERGELFAGEYRSREAPASAAADGHERPLDAVFARLSSGRDRLPDPRGRARTSPELGAVFGRLR